MGKIKTKQYELLDTALHLMEQLEQRKALYQDLQETLKELESLGFTHCNNPNDPTKVLHLVDNFKDKEVAYRAVFIPRLELKSKKG